jgi:hypothetical protein
MAIFTLCGGQRYTRTAPGPTGKAEVYHNIWLVTLAADGRVKEFVEYWMLEV